MVLVSGYDLLTFHSLLNVLHTRHVLSAVINTNTKMMDIDNNSRSLNDDDTDKQDREEGFRLLFGWNASDSAHAEHGCDNRSTVLNSLSIS